MNPQQFNPQSGIKNLNPSSNPDSIKKKKKGFLGIFIFSIGLGILYGNILINIYYSFELNLISLNLYTNKIYAIILMIIFFIFLFYSISSFSRFKQEYIPTSKIVIFLLRVLSFFVGGIISLISGSVVALAFGAIMNSIFPQQFFHYRDVYANFTVWSALFTIVFSFLIFLWLSRKGVRSYKISLSNDFSYKRLQNLTNAINQNPNIALNYNERGVIHSDMKNFDRALEDFNKAIEIDPDFAFAYSNRAIAFNKKGMYLKAIQDANKAIELKSFGFPYIPRGFAYGKSGNTDQALKDYQTAIDLESSLLPYATKCRGETYLDMKKYNLAVIDFETTLKKIPDYKDEIMPMLDEAKSKLKTTILEGDSSDFEQQIVTFLQSGEKVKAVKHYKDISGLSLKESRDKVEEIIKKYNINK